MCVCMNVYVYVCMYVCIYVFMFSTYHVSIYVKTCNVEGLG